MTHKDRARISRTSAAHTAPSTLVPRFYIRVVDENDQPAVVMEKYEKAFTAANVAKEQSFYCRQPILLAPGQLDEPVLLGVSAGRVGGGVKDVHQRVVFRGVDICP